MRSLFFTPPARVAYQGESAVLGALGPFVDAVGDAYVRSPESRSALAAALEAHPELAQYFVLDRAGAHDGFCLRSEHLFMEGEFAPLERLDFTNVREGERITVFGGDGLDEPALATFMQLCADGRHTARDVRAAVPEALHELLDVLLELEILAEGRPAPRFAPTGAPGVYRLQHASVLFRSRHAGVLVDPHLHSHYVPGDLQADVTRPGLEGHVDAILISHGHLDHWDVPSLMQFRKDTPIVVPRVPRASILCDGLAARLRALGFTRVVSPDWYSPPLVFGDIEVRVLPFYGEQPTLDEPARAPDLRNWGNTYHVRTPALTSWVLVDSGQDHLGSMLEVAEHVRDELGGVDIVMSNLRPFAVGSGRRSPHYIACGAYWLSLGPDQIQRFADLRGTITLGPEGVARVCKTAKAKFFLPYAHWWGELGTPADVDDALVRDLASALRRADTPTTIVPWSIGDAFVARGRGDFERAPYDRR